MVEVAISVTNRNNIFKKGEYIMRCPKCGYISFDDQENCKSCRANIKDAVAEVNGTVYNASPPLFLQLEKKQFVNAQPAPDIALDEEARAVELDLEEGIDADFDLGEEGSSLVAEKELEGITLNLDEFSEITPQQELTLDFDEQGVETEIAPPSLDFGDLDISDLAPPEHKEEPPPVLFEEELTLTEPEPVAALSENIPAQQKEAVKKSTGLEDLKLDGLNFDTSAQVVSDKTTKQRAVPSIKTGTALDKFEIDLGELFAPNKK